LSFISLKIESKSAEFNENLKSGLGILQKLRNLFLKLQILSHISSTV